MSFYGKPKRLTALRTMDILESIQDSSNAEWKFKQLRDRLQEHLRAEVISAQRRSKRGES